MDILVSIIMLTYNHEQFIAKAIESVIQQQTSFTYELIIGEDCSTDKTREICLIYKNKYPDKIKLLLHETNIGMQVNAYKSLTSCTGKYIALCEGDDYWTDPYKLQKQVDFLESNPEFSLCHHRYNILYQRENKFELAPIMTNESNLLGCLTDHNISTLTCVFRKKNIEPYLTNFLDFKIGDLPIKLISASTGKIKYFSECMGVYRVHTQGAWNSIDQIDRKMIKIDTLAQLSTLELPSESIALICKFIGIEYFTLFQIQAKLGLHANATSSFQKATNYNTEYVSSEVVNWFINNHVDINNETYEKFINFIKRLKSKIFFNH